MTSRIEGPQRSNRGAFTLVEMLAVVAIISILLALTVPSISSFSSAAGRKGAVSILMNTLEQARAAALETGCDVYVLLWRRQFPERDAIMVVREASPWMLKGDGKPEVDQTGGTSTAKLIPLTKWINLPQGVLLHQPQKGETVFSSEAWPPNLAEGSADIPVPDGGKFSEGDIGVVWYTGDGSIKQPTDKRARIVVSEGVRDGSRVEALISSRKQSQGTGGGFDVITLSRFTGRATLDVTTIQ